jgi:hypothetical protein
MTAHPEPGRSFLEMIQGARWQASRLREFPDNNLWKRNLRRISFGFQPAHLGDEGDRYSGLRETHD